MNIPENLQYTKDHEWVLIEDNIATVGITDYAQDALGEIVYVEIETMDEELDQAEIFGSVEAVKTVSDLFMPVKGKIIEVNEKLEDAPELVNESPYEDGWMIKIELAEDYAEGEPLLDAKGYTNCIEEADA